MPHIINITQRLADTLKLTNGSSYTPHSQQVYSTTTENTSNPTTPGSLKTTRRRKKRPVPIDIDLAHLNRAQQALPCIKSPISSRSEYDPSTPQESRKGTPLYVHIYAQLRSPGSSTPFPTESDTPEKTTMPITAIFEPFTSDMPMTATKSSPSHSADRVSRRFSGPAVSTKAFATQIEIAEYPFSDSKRLRYMLRKLIDPIDTKVETFTTSPTWYRARTPIAGRWDLFRRLSQVRLARLAERASYGEEKFGVHDDEDSEDESDIGSGSDGSSSGWSGLPSPISPLFV